MNKLWINDVHFSHDISSTGQKPLFFEWCRNHYEDYIILTDNSLHLVDNYKNVKVYGWLLESPSITPYAYRFIKTNYHKFHKVFTFDSELLKLSDKFVLQPIGGTWIKDMLIYDKCKLVSMITSNKMMTDGHRLRHDIVRNYGTKFDLYGVGYNHIPNKIEGLKDYMFSIVVENTKKDHYFTEKIIDCFVTGTIPIYWGCDSIGEFFNIDGILRFNSLDELGGILNDINYWGYCSKTKAINENFELAKNYLLADNQIYAKLKKYGF